MNRTSTTAMTVVSIMLMMACDDASNPPSAKERSERISPILQLHTLDRRTPVPLQPMMAWHQKQNMMEHLSAVQRIIDGLSRNDWSKVTGATALLTSSPTMKKMCQHMGAGATGFTDLALDFHRRADGIERAARQQDAASTLRATAHTLQACVDCHASFRQDVVDAATWQERTQSRTAP